MPAVRPVVGALLVVFPLYIHGIRPVDEGSDAFFAPTEAVNVTVTVTGDESKSDLPTSDLLPPSLSPCDPRCATSDAVPGGDIPFAWKHPEKCACPHFTEMKKAEKEFSRKIWEQEPIPFNERKENDPDHWFTLDPAVMLWEKFREFAGSTRQLGKIFTTRMPRSLNLSLTAAEQEEAGGVTDPEMFKHKVETYNVSNVVTMVHDHELREYGSPMLFDFYKQMNLRVGRAETDDFDIPSVDTFKVGVESIAAALWNGRNTLLHCAGGTGRTALFAVGALKYLGVYDAPAWARNLGKSTYIEVGEQEAFLSQMPFFVSQEMAEAAPGMLKWRIAAHLHNVLFMASVPNEHIRELDAMTERVLREAYLTMNASRWRAALRDKNMEDFMKDMSKLLPTVSPSTAPFRQAWSQMKARTPLEPTPVQVEGDYWTNMHEGSFRMQDPGDRIQDLYF